MTTVQAGAAMVPGMLTAAVGMQIAPRLANKIRPGLLISVGVALAAITYVVVTQVGTDSNMTIIVGFALISFFGAPTVALGTGLVVGSAPVEKMGAAGSLAQLANEFGSTLGLAILGTVGAAVYRSTVTLPGDLPADSAAQAGDSIAGATAVAGDLPAGQGEGLVTAAKDAFVDGFQTVAVIGAVLYACAALMVAIRLRHVPAFGAAAAAPAPEKESESKESEPEVV